MPLLALSPIVSVKLKHSWKKPNSSLLYYRRRIPDDIKPLLEASGSEWAGKEQIVISLQTDDPKAAASKIAKLAAKHDKEWDQLRNPSKVSQLDQGRALLRNMGINPGAPKPSKADITKELIFYDLLEETLPVNVKDDLEEMYENGDKAEPEHDTYPHLAPATVAALKIINGNRNFRLSDCLDQYIASRSEKAAKTAKIAFGYLRDFFKDDRVLAEIQRQDANDFVKWLLAGEHNKDGKAIATTTVTRYLNSINAAVARAIRENELDIKNPFPKLEIPNAGKDAKERLPFELDQLKSLHRAVNEWVAVKGWDQPRCIITVLAETGCRLAEVTGLASSDVYLDTQTPYIDLIEHPWRSLKNDKGTIRKVPLTPRAIEAIKAAQTLNEGSKFLFPQYTMADKCKSDSASATLVKWIRGRDGLKDATLDNHGLRHTMKDLLRAVQCPDSIQDQILGHTKGIGAGYGKGYPLEMLAEWINKAVAAVWV